MTWMSELREFYEIILGCGGGMFKLVDVNQETNTITVMHNGNESTINVPNVELTTGFNSGTQIEQHTLIEILRVELARTKRLDKFEIMIKLSLVFNKMAIEVFRTDGGICTPIKRYYFCVY